MNRADPHRFWLATAGDPSRAVTGLGAPDVRLAWGRARPLSLWWGDGDRPTLARQQTPRGECAVMLAGRLHKRDGAEALVESGAGLTSAERVLAAYLAHGSRVVSSLRGAFVLVVWDARDDTVVVARDHMGEHPAFYAERGGALVVSPSPEEIAAGGPSPEPNALAVADWVLLGRTQLDETLFAGVRRLPQGHLLESRPGTVAVTRYWTPPIWDGERAPWDEEESLERFDAALERAVARRLDNGPAAIFLSGGVDSASVASVARDVRTARGQPPPTAFSLAFPDEQSNEEPVQRAVASVLGLPQVVVPLEEAVAPDGILLAGLETARRSWQPCINPWEAAYETLELRSASLGSRTILTGAGGNEILEVPWTFAADLLRRGDVRASNAFAGDLARYFGGARRRYALDVFWRNGLRLLLRDAAVARLPRPLLERRSSRRAAAYAASLPAWVLPGARLRADVVARHRRPAPRRLAGSAAARARALDSVWDTIFTEAVHLSGARAGVAQHAPLYDTDLVTLVFSLPPGHVLLGGIVKGVARETFRRRAGGTVPELVAPSVDGLFNRILDDDAPRALDALGGLPTLAELGIVAANEAQATVAGLESVARVGYYERWQVLAAEAWLQQRFR